MFLATSRLLLPLLSLLLPAVGEVPKAWVEFGRPKDGHIMPPTFDISVMVTVAGDIKAFAKQHLNGAQLCIRLSHSSQSEYCNDYEEPSPGVSDLALGNHSIWAWLRSGDGSGKVVIEAARSDFQVVTQEEYALAVQQGVLDGDGESAEERQAAIAKEEAMTERSIVEWHRRHLLGQSQGQQQEQRTHGWQCHGRSRSADLMIGIKNYAGGFAARDAMRRT